MRFTGLILLVGLFAFAAFAQSDGVPIATEATDETEKEEAISDTKALADAIAIEDAAQRVVALVAFLDIYPDSELRTKARESLSSARASLADFKLRNNETEEGIALFKLAVKEAPESISDELFSKVMVNIPTNLFLLNQRNAAFDLADMLEARSAENYRHLLGLATFYVGIKYATGAKRLAQKAIDLKPDDALGYQTDGLAKRLGFDLAGAEASYARALELAPDSLGIRQSLGDLKRALGKPAEAEELFDQVLAKEPEDTEAKTGLILSLFDQNKRVEAETLLIKELNDNPTNVFVMIGAANWYVVNGEPQLAVDHASQAVSLEESAVWAHIVLARALMKLNRAPEAETTLLAATRFGSNSTLSYELALARSETGFYKEAVEVIRSHFRLENGKIVTDLDGRIGAEAETFADLVVLESKSAIFSSDAPYDATDDASIKSLFEFEEILGKEEKNPEAVATAADAFVNSSESMKTFRQLYAAERLLDQGNLPVKASDLAQEAVSGVEAAISFGNPVSAVLADQLYESRRAAARAGRVVIVPQVEKTVLSKIMRGRIEDIAARSLIVAEDYPSAEIRLRRAVSVLPDDSYWWRASMWRLGTVYQKQGKDKEALSSFAESFASGDSTAEKRIVLEGVYTKINGSTQGLNAFLENTKSSEPDPASLFIKTTADSNSTVTKPAEETKSPLPETDPEKAVPTLREDVILELPESEVKDDFGMKPLFKAVTPKDESKTVLPEDLDLTVVVKPQTDRFAEDSKKADERSTADGTTPVKSDEASPKKEGENAENAAPEKTPASVVKDDSPVPPVRKEPAKVEVIIEKPFETQDLSGATVDENKPDKKEEGKAPPVLSKQDESAGPGENPKLQDAVADISPAKEVVADDGTAKKTDSPKIEETQPLKAEVQTKKEITDSTNPEEGAKKDQPLENSVDPNIKTNVLRQDQAKDPLKEDGANVITKPVDSKKDQPKEEITDSKKPLDVPKQEDKEQQLKDERVDETLSVESADVESKKNGEDKKESVKTDPLESDENVKDEARQNPDVDAKAARKAELIDLGASRPRFVAKENVIPADTEDPKACKVVTSQDRISLIANGGSFGIVVGLTNYEKAYVLRAESLTPENISIVYEPEIGSVDGRAFFVIKSISENLGEFAVKFETPCGTKLVTVGVH